MRILFICGCLEPGKDGVGDYTRLLAREFILLGHQVTIIAINDRYIYEESLGTQNVENKGLSVLRLPSIWPEEKRFRIAMELVDPFFPDWISLQYVPYSFHYKGLPLFFAIYLKKLCGKSHLHIMFHETWIGTGNHFKTWIIASMQIALIKYLVKTLNPSLIHTHLPSYQLKLEELGFKVNSLPLFANIEGNEVVENMTKKFRVGFFSQVSNDNRIILFLTELAEKVSREGLEIEVLLIGGKEAIMQQFRNELEEIKAFKDKIKYTGFLKPKELSEALQNCSIGVSPVPRHGLGKSGSVAAFLAHGVPVAAPIVHHSFDPMYIGFFSNNLRDSIILDPEFQPIKKAKKIAMEAKGEICVSTIANMMLNDIQLSL